VRFLGLSTTQAIVLALITTSAIVAMYFLKHRRRRIVVSSTQLWRNVLENRHENSIFERLRRLLSIILAVVIGLLVALAIARPEIEALTGRARQVVIVLDTSPTMLARTSDGRTRWQAAVQSAESLLDAGGIRTEFRITDTADQFDTPFTSDRTELRKAIEGMHPVNLPSQFPKSALIRTSSGQSVASVYFVTDGVTTPRAPNGVNTISVFEPASNVGITAFEIRSMPSAKLGYEAYLEVYNSGKDARPVEITLSGAGQHRVTRNLRLASGQSFKEAIDVSQFEGGGIRASIRSEGDAFPPDDVAYAYLPVKRRTKTLLVTSGNMLLEAALKLDSLIDLSVTNPKSYTGSGDFDALVFDRFAPAEPPSRPALIIGAQNASWLPKIVGSVSKPSFQSWTEDHPVMRHVSLFDVKVDSAARIGSSKLTVLAASAADTPLIIASERPRWVLLAFDLQLSDFPYHSAFPLFIDNTLAWFDRERLALRRAPGIVDVAIPGAQIRDIDGRAISSRETTEGAVFEAADPGLYVASKGDTRQYIAVNFANRQYSDINNSHIREDAKPKAENPILHRELWFYMLLAATLLFGLEWFTYHRRITV
jgi:aerotolerance regulator-like protein